MDLNQTLDRFHAKQNIQNTSQILYTRNIMCLQYYTSGINLIREQESVEGVELFPLSMVLITADKKPIPWHLRQQSTGPRLRTEMGHQFVP